MLGRLCSPCHSRPISHFKQDGGQLLYSTAPQVRPCSPSWTQAAGWTELQGRRAPHELLGAHGEAEIGPQGSWITTQVTREESLSGLCTIHLQNCSLVPEYALPGEAHGVLPGVEATFRAMYDGTCGMIAKSERHEVWPRDSGVGAMDRARKGPGVLPGVGAPKDCALSKSNFLLTGEA